jgi:hypothetical protein
VQRQIALEFVSARAPPEAANSLARMIVVFLNDEKASFDDLTKVDLEDGSRMIEIGKGPQALPKIAATATCMHREIGIMGMLMVRNTGLMNHFTDLDRSSCRRRCHPATRACLHPAITTTVPTIRWMISIGIGPRLRIPPTISTLWTTEQAIGTGIGIATLKARIVTAVQLQVLVEAVAKIVKMRVVAVTKKVFEV